MAFFSTAEILDIMTITSAITNPLDTVAAFATPHANMFFRCVAADLQGIATFSCTDMGPL
jgi:hypothetical protein